MDTYLFVTKPKYSPQRVESGEDLWWSCSKTTKRGDRALVYVTGPGVQYEWQADSDARPDKKWKYICDVKHVQTFEPAITLREICAAVKKREWAPPYQNFRGYRSIIVPDIIVGRIRALRGNSISIFPGEVAEDVALAEPATKMTTTRRRYRTNDSEAAAILSKLITSGPERRKIAKVFAESCRHAHVQSPSCWDLTLTPSYLRLNVGQVALLGIKGGELFLCAAPSLPRLSAPAEVTISRTPVYAAVPINSVGLRVPLRNAAILDARVLAAHRRYIVEAASRKRTSPWRAAHSPAAVRVISEWSGTDVPQPAYVTTSPDESELVQGEIETALDELGASREVEKTAIRLIRTWYESRGWKVRSVEADKIGYDLRCTKGGKRRHVEVKGRARSGNVVLMTANEWRRAVEDSRFIIAVVSEIGSRTPSIAQWSGPDFQHSHDIKPILYHASRR